MFVKNYICRQVNTIKPDENLADAVLKMVKNKTNSLVVVDESQKPVGIVSSFSLIKEIIPEYLRHDKISAKFDAEGTFEKYAELSKDKLIKDIMNKDFATLDEKDAMIEAAKYSSEEARRVIPVVDKDGVLSGIITRTAIKNALYKAIYKNNPGDNFCGGL